MQQFAVGCVERSMNHAEEIWKTLVRATVDKKHPWRVVSFSSCGADGPQVRSVVLRAAKPAEHTLVFYTDARSQKIEDIRFDPRVALLLWNSRSSEQLRIAGSASIELDDSIRNSLWARIPEYARKDYATLSAPGAVLEASLPEFNLETAWQNFTVLNVKVQAMELLQLDRSGHSRQAFVPDGTGQWQARRLVP
jgi:pyridoxamine 5'-phosphate oxidase